MKIARELISAKLSGQEVLVREKLKDIRTADFIAALGARLRDATDLDAIRGIESRAAAEYWNAWRDLPILFPRKDANRIPSHWLSFGPRHSPLTGGPRLSVNPPNTLLNYINAVAESECRLAACACGLDPALGVLHADTANRDSLALDFIETIRPAIEAWILDWLMHEPLRRSDFIEATNGNCRLSSSLCCKLSETAPIWGKLVAPWAEYVAHSLRACPTDVPPKTYVLRIGPTSKAFEDYFVKAVNLGGKNIADSGFIVRGATYSLDIVVSANGATVEGVAIDDKDKPAPDVEVIFIPDAKHRERYDLYQQAATDQLGHFSLRGLNPGEYGVFALDADVDRDGITDPEFVRAHEALSQTIKLAGGERKNIVVKLAASSD